MMNCKQVTNLLSQYMEGDLSPRDASQVQAHILACRSCADVLERLTKAVDILETTPKDDLQVDLYNAFRSRLERKGSKRRRPALALPQTRRWAVAAMALVLLLGGSLIGGWYQHSRTLYVSNPRVGQSILDSSIAIAADDSLRRRGVDQPLFADSRLTGRIDVTARGESLKRVIGMIAGKCGVEITVSPEIERQQVYLRVGNMPAAQVLSEIRRLFDLDWVITDGRYELTCSRQVMEMASAVAEAQAWAEAEQTLRDINAAIDTRSPGPIEKRIVHGWNGLGHELEQLARDPDHQLSQGVLSLFMLDDEAVSTVLAGRKYERSYDRLSNAQKRYMRDWWERHAGTFCQGQSERWPKMPNDMGLAMWMAGKDDGGINLNIEINYASRNGVNTDAIGLFDPVWGRRNTNLLSADDLRLLYNEARLGNPNYDNSSLDIKLGNRKGVYTLRQTLDLLADRTNLQIVGDCYTVGTNRDRILPRELTLGEMLAVLDQEYNIAWRLEGSTLYLIHRQWPMLRETEPSEEYVGKLNASVRRNGRLSLLELAGLADVSEPQLQGIEAGLEDEILRQNLRNIMWNMRPFLRVYASLTPEHRRMAESKSGLVSSLLSERQKRILVEAAYGYYPDEDFDTGKVQPFIFTVEQFESDVQKVDRMLSGHGNAKRVWAGWVSNGTQEFVAFRLTGNLEEYSIFNWPKGFRK